MNGNSMVDAWTMPSRLSQVRNAENRSRQVSGLGTRKWKVNGDIYIYILYIYYIYTLGFNGIYIYI